MNQLVSTYNTANPFEIADYLGIEYDFKALPNNLKGLLVSSEKDTPLILINEDIQDVSFKYNVMAHELKHAIDHYGLNVSFHLIVSYLPQIALYHYRT